MGTSKSSSGPAGGVPMVPPWVADLPTEDTEGGPDAASESVESSVEPPYASQVAPDRRFAGARRSLGDFARTGDTTDLRRGIGHYVRHGYGGSSTAARRLAGTARVAQTLSDLLRGSADSRDEVLNRSLLAGASAQEVMDAIVEAVRPVDGTLDAESSRSAVRDALSELLTRFPDADLLALSADERAFAVERFTAIDVYRRIQLDVGKTIMDKAPDAATGLARLKQVKNYVKEVVAASFRKLRASGRQLTTGRVNLLVRRAISDTLVVFEGYAE